MTHNYQPSNTMGQNKGLLQDLQSKRQKMENITRHMLNPVPTSSVPSLVFPPSRPGPILSFTNNSLPAPKPKPLKTEEKSLRSQMNEALTFAERTSSGYYVGNASPYGNLLIPAIPRLDPPKDNSFKETRLPRDSI